MDIKTGLSIYNQPWLIEPQAALRMLSYWEAMRGSQAVWDYRVAKSFDGDDTPLTAYAAHQKFFAQEGIAFAPEHRSDLRSFKGFEGSKVAVIPVNGPLMKGDYCGWFGTASMREMVKLADAAKSVETIVLLIDSPGGTVAGTEQFAATINGVSKSTIAVADDMMCSAAYWIGSSARKIVATSDTDFIGSIGTMVSWYDYSQAMAVKGVVLREYYATESRDKNRAYSEADKGDGKKLIEQMLDPLNSVFLQNVRRNREGKLSTEENVLTGKTYTSIDALKHGLIDAIQSMEQVLTDAYNASAKQTKKTTMSTTNNVFQSLLIAANAESFPVVEGGFLLTEENLKSVDAKLVENATTITALTEKVAQLEAKVTDAETASQALASAQEKLQSAEARLAAVEAENEQLKKNAGSFEDAGKQFFGGAAGGGGKDPNHPHEGNTDDVFNMVKSAHDID